MIFGFRIHDEYHQKDSKRNFVIELTQYFTKGLAISLFCLICQKQLFETTISVMYDELVILVRLLSTIMNKQLNTPVILSSFLR